MKKIFKIISGIIIFLIVTLLVLSVLFFEDTYNNRYSSSNSNAKVVSLVISNALKKWGNIA